MACDEAVAGDDLRVHTEVAAAVFDQFVEFLEGVFVEQQFDAFAGGELALAVLAFAAFKTPTLLGGGVAAAEFFKAIHKVEGIAEG